MAFSAVSVIEINPLEERSTTATTTAVPSNGVMG